MIMNENEEHIEKLIYRPPGGEELPVRFIKYGPERQKKTEGWIAFQLAMREDPDYYLPK